MLSEANIPTSHVSISIPGLPRDIHVYSTVYLVTVHFCGWDWHALTTDAHTVEVPLKCS